MSIIDIMYALKFSHLFYFCSVFAIGRILDKYRSPYQKYITMLGCIYFLWENYKRLSSCGSAFQNVTISLCDYSRLQIQLHACVLQFVIRTGEHTCILIVFVCFCGRGVFLILFQYSLVLYIITCTNTRKTSILKFIFIGGYMRI